MFEASPKLFDYPGRNQAWQEFQTQGLPNRHVEYWKYTPLLNYWQGRTFSSLTQSQATPFNNPFSNAIVLECNNGTCINPKALPAGLSVMSWRDVTAKQREYLNHQIDTSRHRLGMVVEK